MNVSVICSGCDVMFSQRGPGHQIIIRKGAVLPRTVRGVHKGVKKKNGDKVKTLQNYRNGKDCGDNVEDEDALLGP
jgi:hypothetical protein